MAKNKEIKAKKRHTQKMTEREKMASLRSVAGDFVNGFSSLDEAVDSGVKVH